VKGRERGKKILLIPISIVSFPAGGSQTIIISKKRSFFEAWQLRKKRTERKKIK